jgi:hypothetical protein
MELAMLRSETEAGVLKRRPEEEVRMRPGEVEWERFMEPFELARMAAWALVLVDMKRIAVSEGSWGFLIVRSWSVGGVRSDRVRVS